MKSLTQHINESAEKSNFVLEIKICPTYMEAGLIERKFPRFKETKYDRTFDESTYESNYRTEDTAKKTIQSFRKFWDRYQHIKKRAVVYPIFFINGLEINPF